MSVALQELGGGDNVSAGPGLRGRGPGVEGAEGPAALGSGSGSRTNLTGGGRRDPGWLEGRGPALEAGGARPGEGQECCIQGTVGGPVKLERTVSVGTG